MTRALALALTLLAAPAAADDHDRARRALERGEVLPLATILPQVETTLGARVIEVDLERDDGRFVYEFELIDARGRIIEAEVDAATGRILEVEGEDD
jgi:uncharacterized membrane protein YkoI